MGVDMVLEFSPLTDLDTVFVLNALWGGHLR